MNQLQNNAIENKEDEKGVDYCGYSDNFELPRENHICDGFIPRFARYSQYKNCDCRMWTYNKSNLESTISPEKLSEAGVFY